MLFTCLEQDIFFSQINTSCLDIRNKTSFVCMHKMKLLKILIKSFWVNKQSRSTFNGCNIIFAHGDFLEYM